MTWPEVPFLQALRDVSGGNAKVPKSDFRNSGALPVVDQGRRNIAGYVSDPDLAQCNELPVIVFGDHTRCFKYIDFPFAVGADGVKILAVEDGFDPKYVFWFLTSLDIPSAGYSRHYKFLKGFSVAKPPLAEQKRIALALDRVDAVRAKRREAIALLDDLAQSIFLDMFGDPVVNAKDWPVRKLEKMGTLDRGVSKHRPRNDPALLGGEFPLIQTGDVAGSGGYITRFTSTYSDLGLNQSRLWPAGTLCITIAANIAKTGILTFDACFPDSVVGFTASPARVEYIRAWLSFLQEALEASAPESAQKNINLAVLRNLEIPYPGEDLIRVFSERVKVIEVSKDAHRTHLATLDELFTSLQHRAFSGTLWDHEATGGAA